METLTETVVCLWSMGHFPLIEGLFMQLPSRAPTSPILLTPVVPPYQARDVWKGLCITTSLACSTIFLWKDLEEDQAASGDGVFDRWSQTSGSLGLYRSDPKSKLEEADPCTQIDPSQAHPGPVNAATNSE